MSAASVRHGGGGGGIKGSGRVGGAASAAAQQQPSTSTGGGKTQSALGGASTTAAEDDEEWARSSCSRPSFACDDRALAEMRLAVGSILEGEGFTHAAASALELLTDIGVRYMRKLAVTATTTAEQDGRTRATDADVLAGFRTMRVNIDEMNEYMRQVRPVAEPRVIPVFPLPIAPTPIVHTPVPPSLVVPPPEIAFPGLPPMSTAWLCREDLEKMIVEKEKENNEQEQQQQRRKPVVAGPEEVKRMLASFSGADAVPCFFTKSASAFGLRRGDRAAEGTTKGRGGQLRVDVGEDETTVDSRKRPDKRKNAESKAIVRIPKISRPSSSHQDQPGPSSLNAFAAALYGTSRQTSSASSSRPPSRPSTPSMAATAAAGLPSGSISALRDATRNVPPAGALAPEYASTYTEGVTPLRVPGLLAAFGRGGSENRELDRQRQQQQPLPSPLARSTATVPVPPPPPARRSPLHTFKTINVEKLPTDGPPTKLVQLAIMRALFTQDGYEEDPKIKKQFLTMRPLSDELDAAYAVLKATASTTTATTTTAKKASGGGRGATSSYRKSTPLPAPPPPAPPITPRLVIKPLVKPPTPPTPPPPATSSAPSYAPLPHPVTPVTATPLAPLRLKINIGARPSNEGGGATSRPPTPAPAPTPSLAAPEAYDAATAAFVDDETSTAGPSSAASTIPLLFSPATAAAVAAAEGKGAEQAEEEEDEERGEDGKKKKKKHKKEKKEKKEKKHKRHKKERDEIEDGGEASRSISRASAQDLTVESVPSPAPGGPIKLKIRLGPRPTE